MYLLTTEITKIVPGKACEGMLKQASAGDVRRLCYNSETVEGPWLSLTQYSPLGTRWSKNAPDLSTVPAAFPGYGAPGLPTTPTPAESC